MRRAGYGWTRSAGKVDIRVSSVHSSGNIYGQSGTVTFRPGNGAGQPITLTVTQKPYIFSLVYSKVLPGGGTAGAPRSVMGPDGSVVFVTTVSSTDPGIPRGHGDLDAWVIKLNAAGDTVWTRTLGGTGVDRGNAIALTQDDGYVIIGVTESADGDITDKRAGYGQDLWAIKLDGDGHTVWSKTFGGSGMDVGYAGIATLDGGCLLGGSTTSKNGDVTGVHGASDAWVIKLDKQGRSEWSKVYGGSNDEQINAITATQEGYVLAGITFSNDGDVKGFHPTVNSGADMLVVRIDRTGNLAWAKAFGGTDNEVANAIVTAPDGVLVAGYTSSNDGDVTGYHGLQSSRPDMWVLKVNNDGAIIWAKTFGGSRDDIATSVAVTPDGGYVLAGTTISTDGDVVGTHIINFSTLNDVWIVKLDAAGNKQWTKALGGSGDDIPYSILPGPTGYLIQSVTSSLDGDVSRHVSGGQYNHWMTWLVVQ